jgi:hypothetical protein
MNLDQQLKVLNRVTNKAIRQVKIESKNKRKNFIAEWFRYVEIVSKQLKKWLN